MSERKISRDSLRAMAGLAGLDLSDDKLDELLPQVERMLEPTEDLDVLDIGSVEPAVVFRPDEE